MARLNDLKGYANPFSCLRIPPLDWLVPSFLRWGQNAQHYFPHTHPCPPGLPTDSESELVLEPSLDRKVGLGTALKITQLQPSPSHLREIPPGVVSMNL